MWNGKVLLTLALVAVGCGGESSSPGTGGVGELPGTTGGAPAGSGGGAVGEGASTGEPKLGEACPSTGALGCADGTTTGRLVCSADLFWVDNGSCDGDTICAVYDEARLGECITVEPACAGRAGETFCHDGAPLTCHPDETGTPQPCENCDCPAGDACPVGDFKSCASDCGGADPGCTEACSQTLGIEGSTVIRVSPDELCAGCTPRMAISPYGDATIRATIGEGWRFGDLECPPTDQPVRCLVVGPEVGWFWVVAESAESPPRNLVIEEVPPGTTCP